MAGLDSLLQLRLCHSVLTSHHSSLFPRRSLLAHCTQTAAPFLLKGGRGGPTTLSMINHPLLINGRSSLINNHSSLFLLTGSGRTCSSLSAWMRAAVGAGMPSRLHLRSWRLSCSTRGWSTSSQGVCGGRCVGGGRCGATRVVCFITIARRRCMECKCLQDRDSCCIRAGCAHKENRESYTLIWCESDM